MIKEAKIPLLIIDEIVDYLLRSKPLRFLDTLLVKHLPTDIAKKQEDTQDFMQKDQELKASCDRQEIVALIGENGPGVNYIFNDGETPLIKAIKNGHCHFAGKLIACGARVDDTDSYDKTALHWAAEMGKADLVRLLAEHKARRDLKDAYGMVALSNVRGEGYMSEFLAFSTAYSRPPLKRVTLKLNNSSSGIRKTYIETTPSRLTRSRQLTEDIITSSQQFKGRSGSFHR